MSSAPQRQEYLDIVWHQFRQNRFAYVALWLLAPVFLIAIYAPLLASDQPLVLIDHGQALFPWWHAIFNPQELVDLGFNMALLVSVAFLPLAIVINLVWKRHGMSGRKRLTRLLFSYVGLSLGLLVLVLAHNKAVEREWLPSVLPKNTYAARDFGVEIAAAPDDYDAWYALIPYSPQATDLAVRYQPPNTIKPVAQQIRATDDFPHYLGTDDTGRDVLMLMIYGTRIAMTVGFLAVSIYLTIGSFLGAIAGYFGGWMDMAICRVIEVMLLFPAFFLILTLVALIGPNIYIIMVVIGLTGWPTIARLIRGEVLKQRALEYTIAAQAMGASKGRIIFRHILPNAIAPVLVSAPFGIAGAIITEAGLSLLGFGVSPPTPSWGQLLHLVQEDYSHWWLLIVPAFAIFFTVTIFNLVGSGLRDAMDPRLRKAA